MMIKRVLDKQRDYRSFYTWTLRRQRRPTDFHSVPQTTFSWQPSKQQWLNPLTGLIGVNILVWGVYQQANYRARQQHDFSLRRFLHRHFDADLANVEAGRFHSLILHAFAHQAFGHLLFNMLSLHVFGSMLVQRIGYRSLIKVYAGAGVCSGLAHVGLQLYYKQKAERERPKSLWQPRRTNYAMPGAIGASGAVMGIGVMTALRMPYASVYLYGLIPIPMWALILGFGAYDTYNVATSRQLMSGTGHMAHLGGAAFGALAHFVLRI